MKKFQVDENQKLTPDQEYISDSINLIETHMSRIHNHFYKKYIIHHVYEKFLD